MNKSINYCFLLLALLISCNYSNPTQDKVDYFNSFMNSDTTLVIDEFPEILDNWFLKHTKGATYNGTEMKSLLMYLSKYNNVGGFIAKSIDCKKNTDLNVKILEQINQIALSNNGYRKMLNKSNFLGSAITEYAYKTQDSLLINWAKVELDIIYSPSSICEDYGNLKPEQLEDPIIKRLLFIELFLPIYMTECE